MSDGKGPPRTVDCPICGKAVTWNAASRWRPFCSQRCQLIDLGEWFGEEKRIPGAPLPPNDGDSDSELH